MSVECRWYESCFSYNHAIIKQAHFFRKHMTYFKVITYLSLLTSLGLTTFHIQVLRLYRWGWNLVKTRVFVNRSACF